MTRVSLPVRECGLKCIPHWEVSPPRVVTPRAGVWIEIARSTKISWQIPVTPRAGVWIEINLWDSPHIVEGVTPRAGVWIEIDPV